MAIRWLRILVRTARLIRIPATMTKSHELLGSANRPDGERRTLADYDLSGYVEGLHQPLPPKARPKMVVN